MLLPFIYDGKLMIILVLDEDITLGRSKHYGSFSLFPDNFNHQQIINLIRLD